MKARRPEASRFWSWSWHQHRRRSRRPIPTPCGAERRVTVAPISFMLFRFRLAQDTFGNRVYYSDWKHTPNSFIGFWPNSRRTSFCVYDTVSGRISVQTRQNNTYNTWDGDFSESFFREFVNFVRCWSSSGAKDSSPLLSSRSFKRIYSGSGRYDVCNFYFFIWLWLHHLICCLLWADSLIFGYFYYLAASLQFLFSQILSAYSILFLYNPGRKILIYILKVSTVLLSLRTGSTEHWTNLV